MLIVYCVKCLGCYHCGANSLCEKCRTEDNSLEEPCRGGAGKIKSSSQIFWDELSIVRGTTRIQNICSALIVFLREHWHSAYMKPLSQKAPMLKFTVGIATDTHSQRYPLSFAIWPTLLTHLQCLHILLEYHLLLAMSRKSFDQVWNWTTERKKKICA